MGKLIVTEFVTLTGSDQRHRALTELSGIPTWHEMSLSSRPELNRETRNDPWGRSHRQPNVHQTRSAAHIGGHS